MSAKQKRERPVQETVDCSTVTHPRLFQYSKIRRFNPRPKTGAFLWGQPYRRIRILAGDLMAYHISHYPTTLLNRPSLVSSYYTPVQNVPPSPKQNSAFQVLRFARLGHPDSSAHRGPIYSNHGLPGMSPVFRSL